MSFRAEPSAEEVRRSAREIFEREEFRRTKSPLARFMEWLGEQIQRLLEALLPGDAMAGAPGGSGLAQLIAYLMIALLVVALAVLVVRVIRRAPARRRRAKGGPDGVTVEVEELRTVSEWKSLAEQWEAEGRWKEALRARYRELVRSLVDRDVLPPVPGRTTRELCADLADTAAAASEDFDAATRLFEVAWYADEPTGSAENRRFRELANAVIVTVASSPTAGARPVRPEPVGASA